MRTVHKYKFGPDDFIELDVPRGAVPIHFAYQNDGWCLWMLVDPSRETEPRVFRMAGTGHPIHEQNVTHIGSTMSHGGALVFHLFEVSQ